MYSSIAGFFILISVLATIGVFFYSVFVTIRSFLLPVSYPKEELFLWEEFQDGWRRSEPDFLEVGFHQIVTTPFLLGGTLFIASLLWPLTLTVLGFIATKIILQQKGIS